MILKNLTINKLIDPHGISGFKIKGFLVKIMLRIGSYVLKELQEPDFIFLAAGPGSILGSQNFFKKKYLSKFFVAKMKKTLIIMSQKLLCRLCVC